jgi:ATP-dependent DNA helicase RecG
MTVYGDLDVSVIDEMPKNRKPIKTFLRGENKLNEIYKFITDKSKEGLKTYIIYPLVKESDKLELKAAVAHYEELKNHYLKNLQVGLIHGQISSKEKEEVMSRFAQGQYDVLVGTTVIEVGIDIPEANIIVINDAHRFGLSQLHQLRGRVGRGDRQSFCILVTKDEFAEKINSTISAEFISATQLEKQKTTTRLQAMVKYNSGFDIAEIDFKLRGPGDIFGIRQSGMPELKYVNVLEDTTIIMQARDAAFRLIADDPKLNSPSHKIIRTNLLSSYKDKLHYSKIA